MRMGPQPTRAPLSIRLLVGDLLDVEPYGPARYHVPATD
jgi:hypothetical protein